MLTAPEGWGLLPSVTHIELGHDPGNRRAARYEAAGKTQK